MSGGQIGRGQGGGAGKGEGGGRTHLLSVVVEGMFVCSRARVGDTVRCVCEAV